MPAHLIMHGYFYVIQFEFVIQISKTYQDFHRKITFSEKSYIKHFIVTLKHLGVFSNKSKWKVRTKLGHRGYEHP